MSWSSARELTRPDPCAPNSTATSNWCRTQSGGFSYHLGGTDTFFVTVRQRWECQGWRKRHKSYQLISLKTVMTKHSPLFLGLGLIFTSLCRLPPSHYYHRSSNSKACSLFSTRDKSTRHTTCQPAFSLSTFDKGVVRRSLGVTRDILLHVRISDHLSTVPFHVPVVSPVHAGNSELGYRCSSSNTRRLRDPRSRRYTICWRLFYSRICLLRSGTPLYEGWRHAYRPVRYLYPISSSSLP